jgi:translation initiation factor eIF-2B subunit delta
MINEAIEEIREMQTHSETSVAVKAARALEELLERDYPSVDEFERDLEHNAGALRRANVSHALLHVTMQEILRAVVGEADSVEEVKDLTQETIDRWVKRVQQGKHDAATNAAETISDGDTLLTHAYSSTVVQTLRKATADGERVTVYVDETRPRFLGRKVIRELVEMDGVDAHLIVDGAAGFYLREADRVLLGMNCVVGDTYYNRIGTYPVVVTANELGVPVTVVGSSTKVIEGGFVFENEFRPSTEVLKEPADGFEVENPGYDSTPLSLVDEILTDVGRISF